MPQPSDGTSHSEQVRVLEIVARARSMPPAQRDSFVRREAADDAFVRDRVLALLQDGDTETVGLAAGPRTGSAHPSTRSSGSPSGEAGDLVHASETDELLAKLAKSPKLDPERFAVEGEVGKGGMGAVYRVHDRHLNRRLAIKVLLERGSPKDREEQAMSHQLLGRFLEEAQVSSQLDHPGVVPVHELGLDHEGKVWFTMRLVKGRTASEVFADAHAQRDGWSLMRGIEVVLKVCDTMAYAHEKGVLHRDLKPSNVMVGRFGEVYVMDWGLAKVTGHRDRHDVRIRPDGAASSGASRLDTARKRDTEHDTGSSVVTMDGAKLGTPSYMSPEQARGEVAVLDVRADVYAIGAMVYELVTGRAPYVVPGVWKPAYRILDDVADGPPKAIEQIQKGVPPELVAIVKRAMARDREHRYPDTAALATDLRAFLGLQVVQAYRTGALVELKMWVRRNMPLAASLVAAVLILVVGIVGMSWLANENAALAAAETKARREAASRAEENAGLARSESEAKDAATRLAAEKGRTVANFQQLSVVVRLQDVLAEQDSLWPAMPEKVEALRAWLDDACAPLLAQRPQIEATIAELRGKAAPLTREQIEADRRAAAEWPAYERQQQLVAALQRARALRTGSVRLELPELPASLRDADASALNRFAWPRVAPEPPDGEKPERTIFGEEAVALVAARTAVVKGAGKSEFLDTLAWAALANGQDEEARQSTAEALAKAPTRERDAYEGYQRAIAAAIAEAPIRLSSAETRLAALDGMVSERRTWMFGRDAEGESARFLHDALLEVLAGLHAMADKEKLDVERRLSWAQQVRAASLGNPKAGATWAAAREAIAKADDVVASNLYAGCDIPLPDEVVIGLVPIGMNPVSKLWEFYDLRSAWDGEQAATDIDVPRHREDGSIEMQAGTGIVFVLLPGGTVTLGSQKDDPKAPYYDPRPQSDERMHEVALTPFLLARHELTRGQWQRLAGDQLTLWTEGLRYNGDRIVIGRTHPADSMDWETGDRWLRRHGMVLPTEAQWEYGARAGTTTAYWPGSLAADLQGRANVHDRTSFAVYPQWGEPVPIMDGFRVIAPVASFEPNRFGLYDIHGNLWEWCRDWYGDYGSERAGDGLRSPGASRVRAIRGGSYDSSAGNTRSAYRSHNPPSIRYGNLGLRPSRSITY